MRGLQTELDFPSLTDGPLSAYFSYNQMSNNDADHTQTYHNSFVSNHGQTSSGLPGAEKVNSTFKLHKVYEKTTPPLQSEVTQMYTEIFDRIKYFAKLRLLMMSLVEKAFINARSSQDVFYSLLTFSLQLMFEKTILKREHLQSLSNLPVKPKHPQSYVFDNLTLTRLLYEYQHKKDIFFKVNRQELDKLLVAHSIPEIVANDELSRNVLFKVSSIDDVLSLDDFGSLYMRLDDFRNNVGDYTYYKDYKHKYMKILENLSPYSLQFPTNLYYGLQNSIMLTSISESIKSVYVPSYDHAPLVEFYNDLVLFGNFLKKNKLFFNMSMQKDIDEIKDDYKLLADFVSSCIQQVLPAVRNTDYTLLSPAVYFSLSKRWTQILPELVVLITNNSSVSGLKKVFALYFYAAFQLFSNIFGQTRYFFIMKNLHIDYLATGWFNGNDFKELFNSGEIKNPYDQMLNTHLKSHSIYLIRLISFFRMRRLIILRYLKLNTKNVIDYTNDDAAFKKQLIKNNANEVHIKSFKETIFKPEHFIHCADPAQLENEDEDENYDTGSEDLENEESLDGFDIANHRVIRFSRPKDEVETFFVLDYETYTKHYYNNFSSMLIKYVSETSNTANPNINAHRFEQLTNDLNQFLLYSFVNSNNNLSYFDVLKGLLKFDFNPFEDLEKHHDLKSNIQSIAFGIISKYLEQKAHLLKNFNSQAANNMVSSTSESTKLDNVSTISSSLLAPTFELGYLQSEKLSLDLFTEIDTDIQFSQSHTDTQASQLAPTQAQQNLHSTAPITDYSYSRNSISFTSGSNNDFGSEAVNHSVNHSNANSNANNMLESAQSNMYYGSSLLDQTGGLNGMSFNAFSVGNTPIMSNNYNIGTTNNTNNYNFNHTSSNSNNSSGNNPTDKDNQFGIMNMDIDYTSPLAMTFNTATSSNASKFDHLNYSNNSAANTTALLYGAVNGISGTNGQFGFDDNAILGNYGGAGAAVGGVGSNDGSFGHGIGMGMNLGVGTGVGAGVGTGAGTGAGTRNGIIAGGHLYNGNSTNINNNNNAVNVGNGRGSGNGNDGGAFGASNRVENIFY